MKKLIIYLVPLILIILFACKKDEQETQNFRYLTDNTWLSDSLLANGEDAGGPGQILHKFNGEAIFHKDGTGVFGQYDGEWRFAYDETKIIISSDSLQIPLTTDIEVLTDFSLKITTVFPNFADPNNPTAIRMTFNAR